MRRFLKKILGPTHPIRMIWYKMKGMSAALLYAFPARRLNVIGVTGTDGKTTTTHLIESILHAAGKKVAMISTVAFKIDGQVEPNVSKLTTLSPFATQKFLRRCVTIGIEVVIIESSSHALHQSRLWGIPFKVGVITNVTHEHLDYHRTMEKYKEAKKILFKNVAKNAGAIIANAEDTFFQDFMSVDAPKKWSYGLNAGRVQGAEVGYKDRKSGIHFTLKGGGIDEKIQLQLAGIFNVQNALAAACTGLACGIPLPFIKKGLEGIESVPGRLEFFKSPKGYDAVVDFALTPNALLNLYRNLKQMNYTRIIGIIGSCGERDKEKRPRMGKIVAEHSDITIVTDEEPYSENPRAIMDAIMEGARQTSKKEGIDLLLIEDRYQAIHWACQHAQPNDLVVVTGMGAFTTRTMNHGEVPWDERKVVQEIMGSSGGSG